MRTFRVVSRNSSPRRVSFHRCDSGMVTLMASALTSTVSSVLTGASADVEAEAERMAGRVDEHPHVLLRLVRRQRGPERHCLLDGGVEVADLEVEVHHRPLLALL